MEPAGVDAGVLGGSRGMEGSAGKSNEQVTSAETKGVAVEVLATLDLAGEIESLKGHQLRMRMVAIEPGGVFGPIHDQGPTRHGVHLAGDDQGP